MIFSSSSFAPLRRVPMNQICYVFCQEAWLYGFFLRLYRKIRLEHNVHEMRAP